MSSRTRVADDFASIRQRIAELEAEKKPAELPKAWPSFTAVDQDYSGQDVFVPYDYDPA